VSFSFPLSPNPILSFHPPNHYETKRLPKKHRSTRKPEIRRPELRGHYAYYGITGNFSSLKSFEELVKRIWRYWLNRRNRERSLAWTIMGRLLKRYPLARPRIVRRARCHVANLQLE